MELTQHVKERYAERMAGRDSRIDINTFVAQNTEKIEKDIDKLIEYSEVIYTGVCPGFKQPVVVRLSGTWVIVLDRPEKVVITIFKINLGLDESMNKAYVEGWRTILNEAKKKLEEKKADVKKRSEEMRTSIEENKRAIAEFKASAKKLEQLNEAYEEAMKDMFAECIPFEQDVNRAVDAFTSRRTF